MNDSRIERALSVCRKAVAAFSSSWKRRRDLKEAQTQKGLPQKKLKGYVCTRWYSKVEMVKRMVEQQDAVSAVLGQDRRVSHLVPTWQDLDVLQSILDALKDFNKLTDLLSGEKRVTFSAINPLIKLIGDKYVSPEENDSELTLEIKVHIKEDIESRCSSDEINLLCDTCSFLDPRFKDNFDLEHIAVHTLLEEVQSIDVIHQPTESENIPNFPKPAKKGKFSQVFGTRSASPLPQHECS